MLYSFAMGARAPDVLLLMADQMPAAALAAYGGGCAKTPHLDSLAAQGAVLENCYTGFPLCAPARFSMIAGQTPSTIGAWDNGAEFCSEHPTLAHYLRAEGYRTCVSGKMHFVGADQLHGFEERLTTDICPSDFGWTATWDEPQHVHPWFHTMQFASEGGVVARSVQMDFDEETAHQTVRKLYQWGRDRRAGDARPFFLMHSMTHPHDPYVCTREYWERHKENEIDLPRVPFLPPEKRDAHSRSLFYNYDRGEYPMDEQRIKNSRRGFYGNMSFVDDIIGRVLSAADAAGLDDNLVVVFCSDHGDMLGERGMWYKMSFYDWSARVPMIVRLPGGKPKRVRENVSLFDIMPTLVDIAADGDIPALLQTHDGKSFRLLLDGVDGDGDGNGNGSVNKWHDTAISEYLCEAVAAPYVMLRRGKYKYMHCEEYPPQLFDMEEDPDELRNLADDAEAAAVLEEIQAEVSRRWDFAQLKERILISQRRRLLAHRALTTGRAHSWDFQPFEDAARQYYRGGGSYQDIEKKDLLPYPQKSGGGKKSEQ